MSVHNCCDSFERAVRPIELVAELTFAQKAFFETCGYWWVHDYDEERSDYWV